MRSILTSVLTAVALATSAFAATAEPTAASVTAALKRSADWALAHPSGMDTRFWVIAPLYDGLFRTATATGDATYLATLLRFGNQSGWKPGDRIYHADDHAVSHAWLDLYALDRTRPERVKPTRERLDYILTHPVTEAVAHGKKPTTPGVTVSDRWSWCDALYMAPPTLARLAALTGDAKYLAFLDREFRYTYDHLYDPAEHLFFRDATFFDKKTPAGKKTFWSRGNGWVYGGLALTLEHLPANHPTRGFYEKLFREMTGAILAAQQPDGLWRPSMLDPAQVPLGETSGSGFFVFGLAWGVNHGLLDRTTHWPAITRGWAGLLTRIKPDGYVGYVQAIGAAPAPLTAESKQDYGTGAFLLAGSELLRALGAAPSTPPAALLAAAESRLAAESKTPRAYARLVPERMDDLAWENDKVAFRVYGPALRSAVEDSGIDLWFKRVSYPVIDKWYRQDLTQKISYHKDHGEGYDAYKVGDTRGCGGLGLWIDGKLVISDTYISATILWTAPDVAEFKTVYAFPVKIAGQPVYEHRLTRLRLGSRFSEITSFFSHTADRNAKPLADFPHEVALGVITQNARAPITLDRARGFASVYDSLDGKGFGSAVLLDPARVLRMEKIPATDSAKKHEHAAVLTRVDADGRVSYRTGFAWSGDGDLTTPDAWLHFLHQQTSLHQP